MEDVWIEDGKLMVMSLSLTPVRNTPGGVVHLWCGMDDPDRWTLRATRCGNRVKEGAEVLKRPRNEDKCRVCWTTFADGRVMKAKPRMKVAV